MKTLDEVIIEMTNMSKEDRCMYCPFDIETDGSLTCERGKCVYDDALHYLIDFKLKRDRVMAQVQACDDRERRLQEEIARYQEAVKACEAAENKYRRLIEGTSQNCASTSQSIVCPKCGLRMEI